MLTVGIPKEIKTLEKRVGLTPAGVKKLTDKHICVYVETLAGDESGFTDAQYEASGAFIVPTKELLYEKSQLIQKVKEPLAAEFPLIRSDHILFCFLHLASQENCALKNILIKSLSTSVGFETLQVEGRIPMLAPMSEIAGGLSVLYAAIIPSLSSPSSALTQ